MKVSHQKSEDKYAHARSRARELALVDFSANLRESLKLSDINQMALAQSKKWELEPERKVDWEWHAEPGLSSFERPIPGHLYYAYRHPNRFELAIWYHSILCGLSLGKPTWSGSKLRLDYIEAAPSNNPMRSWIVPVTIAAAKVYADAIGATQIRIMNPINAKVRSYYESFGFTFVSGKTTFCYKDLV